MNQQVTSANSFRDQLNAHRDAGTCYLCTKVVEHGEAVHGATGAHWDCEKSQRDDFQTTIRQVDSTLATLGVKPKRKPEGKGETAKAAIVLATAALEAVIGVPIFDVAVWNQQGAYRGPKWDLDAWGMSFSYSLDGHLHRGSASSLATMTACVRAKGLKASDEHTGLPGMYDLFLYNANKPETTNETCPA